MRRVNLKMALQLSFMPYLTIINTTTKMLLRIVTRTCRRLAPAPLLLSLAPFPFCTHRIKKTPLGEQSEEEKLFSLEQEIPQALINNYKEVIPNYPFHSIPIGIIRNPNKFPIPPQHLHTLIAFKAIKARSEDVKLAAAILLPERGDYESFGDESGRFLFSEYFAPQCSTLISELNAGSGSLDERIGKMQILINMQIDENYIPKATVKQLDLRALANQDESGVLVAYAVHLLIRHQLQYTHLLQLITSKLEDKAVPAASKTKIAKAIITVFRFEDYFSQKMIELSLSALSSCMDSTHNYELLFIIRNIYTYPHGKSFAEELQRYLIRKHIDEHNIDFHIPLVLKTIKYCSKQGVSTRQLTEFITNNMKRFQIIFDKSKMAKGLFFSLLFEKHNKDISQEMIGHLKTYFLDSLATFVRSQETEESELIRFNKLLIRYFTQFSEKEQEYLRNQYFQKMIPYYSESNQVLFYSLLVYLRTKAPQEEQNANKAQTLKKYIQLYFQRCCTKSNGQLLVASHINSVIEMAYQVLRHNIPFSKYELPFICSYNFSQKDSLNPQNVNHFFYYLVKNQHETKEAARQALTSLEPLLEVFIRKRKIYSLKTFLNIIDACDRVSFEHNFFFKLLQNILLDFLVKNPKFILMENDLKFINEKFLKRGYGSPKLKQMVISTLQKGKNWEENRRNYVQSELKYQQSLTEKRRNRVYTPK